VAPNTTYADLFAEHIIPSINYQKVFGPAGQMDYLIGSIAQLAQGEDLTGLGGALTASIANLSLILASTEPLATRFYVDPAYLEQDQGDPSLVYVLADNCTTFNRVVSPIFELLLPALLIFSFLPFFFFFPVFLVLVLVSLSSVSSLLSPRFSSLYHPCPLLPLSHAFSSPSSLPLYSPSHTYISMRGLTFSYTLFLPPFSPLFPYNNKQCEAYVDYHPFFTDFISAGGLTARDDTISLNIGNLTYLSCLEGVRAPATSARQINDALFCGFRDGGCKSSSSSATPVANNTPSPTDDPLAPAPSPSSSSLLERNPINEVSYAFDISAAGPERFAFRFWYNDSNSLREQTDNPAVLRLGRPINQVEFTSQTIAIGKKGFIFASENVMTWRPMPNIFSLLFLLPLH
jgi:hypothetical protein